MSITYDSAHEIFTLAARSTTYRVRLPLLDKNDYGSVDVERVKSMVDQFMENGFTYFDTAAPYRKGNSEAAFRKAVAKRYPRTAYTMTDKLSLFMIRDKSEFSASFEGKLDRRGLCRLLLASRPVPPM